jgi:carboxylesterase type B
MVSGIVSVTQIVFPLLILAGSCFSSLIPARDNDQNPSSQFPTARTRQATYVGKEDTNYDVDIWAGVRYAKPPTGPLRLQPPQPYEAQGTINSQTFGNPCFALSSTANISEDCLTLNIYTPHSGSSQHYKKRNSDGLPVMFWIHGGGFNQGSGIGYGGQSLVNRSVELRSPVIVVTINYRLSFFGFSGNFPQPHSRASTNLPQLAPRQLPTML